MENEKRRKGNGEWGMGEKRMENGEWREWRRERMENDGGMREWGNLEIKTAMCSVSIGRLSAGS